MERLESTPIFAILEADNILRVSEPVIAGGFPAKYL
jgi:hypothetical protein